MRPKSQATIPDLRVSELRIGHWFDDLERLNAARRLAVRFRTPVNTSTLSSRPCKYSAATSTSPSDPRPCDVERLALPLLLVRSASQPQVRPDLGGQYSALVCRKSTGNTRHRTFQKSCEIGLGVRRGSWHDQTAERHPTVPSEDAIKSKGTSADCACLAPTLCTGVP